MFFHLLLNMEIKIGSAALMVVMSQALSPSPEEGSKFAKRSAEETLSYSLTLTLIARLHCQLLLSKSIIIKYGNKRFSYKIASRYLVSIAGNPSITLRYFSSAD